ncbi:MAG: hypothetical protein HYU48_01085 [Candidatus Levybacteria bacterium]|nr:hypothetical protein [Candidatus Levybacteria bacterium]
MNYERLRQPDVASFFKFVESLEGRTAQLELIAVSGFDPKLRAQMRWRIEGVVEVKMDGNRVFEYRGDGHVNMVDWPIVYTTEPEDSGERYHGEPDIWRPLLTPDGKAKDFRVRGLV